jgi:1,2-diacylglycerol 3-beta-galactosyltransferase
MRRIAALLALACSAHGFRGSRVGRRSRAAAVEYLTRPQDTYTTQQQRPPVRLTPRPASAVTSTASTTAQAPSTGKKKVLFLMSDTGGGHRASSKALVNALERLYPGKIDAEIVDIWTEHAGWPYRNFVPYYAIMAKRTWMWRMMWYYGRFWPTRKLQEIATRIQCSRRFGKCIADAKPDLVVSVHPLCQDIPLRQLAKIDGGSRKTPFVTVVTDLGSAHNTWFDGRGDYTFVPSDALEKMASRCGVPDDKIIKRGLPLREGFWDLAGSEKIKEATRNKLGLTTGVPTALVVGGGDGVGGIAKVATALGDALGEAKDPSGLVVVCGKNAAVKKELEERQWPENVKPTILGFVDNMDEWMAAADCIVTKAGPGTIAEAATRGLPCLLSSHLPGQEAGNVKFVVEGGFGAFVKKPAKIGATIAQWFADLNLREKLSSKALEAARPSATLDIARDIGGLLFEGKAPQQA